MTTTVCMFMTFPFSDRYCKDYEWLQDFFPSKMEAFLFEQERKLTFCKTYLSKWS